MADVKSMAACPESTAATAEQEYRDKLLALIKKEVKHIMEEAVTKKSVHEESSSVSSLCCAIDACLSHGLKRRALGLFKTNSTTALIQKVSKNYEPAAQLYRMVQEIDSSDSPMLLFSMSTDSPTHRTGKDRRKAPARSSRSHKLLWIKLALFQKKLSGIVDHLVVNSSKYYDKEALLSDPVQGEIFASLLIGPCALEYSKIKSQDHFWSDPSADELMQRHRLSNHPPAQNGNLTPPPGRRPLGVSYRWPTSSLDFGGKPFPSSVSNGSETGESTPRSTSLACSPRDFVDSLHQNCRSTLLYGKNNVVVRAKGQESPVPGYLSLHSTPCSLLIKWTPNQIMRVSDSDPVNASPPPASASPLSLWDLAMSVNMEEIVYLHCHQNDTGGTMVLVGQDGVQMPPMLFPAGGHLLAFLTCLETGLQPFGQLDPPLATDKGKEKAFPKLRLKGRAVGRDKSDTNQGPEHEEENGMTDKTSDPSSSDYVFRIIANFHRPESITQEMFEPNSSPSCKSSPGRWSSWLKRTTVSDSSASSTMSRSTDGDAFVTNAGADQSIASMCESMRRQILCRAFYGWLTHTRHIRTVRNHLSELVNLRNEMTEERLSGGLEKSTWDSMHDANGCIPVDRCHEIFSLLYFGGCDPSIRTDVWPYLLNHYQFGMTAQERRDRDREVQQHYEITMTEWLAIEVIVKQRDREIAAANLAKFSSESTAESSEFTTTEDRNDSNDVFSESQVEPDERSEAKTSKALCMNECERKVRISRQKQLESRGSQTVSDHVPELTATDKGTVEESAQLTPASASQCPSPTSSNGGVYSTELLDLFSLNLHRIEKDVQRCDRNYPFYMEKENLEKLRNIMCTYVWENLDQGYVQGMCDLLAPLLVIFEDEGMSYSCFIDLMKRMVANFPYGGAMDAHFANLRSLIQVLDYELFELMHANGDYTHFYFCYRWFLLDFKRELLYDDVFRVWEAIWSAKSVCTSNFVLFIAAALVKFYRDIIIGNNMDFTDIIKFFNEMAERHDAKAILKIARGLVREIQTMVDEL